MTWLVGKPCSGRFGEASPLFPPHLLGERFGCALPDAPPPVKERGVWCRDPLNLGWADERVENRRVKLPSARRWSPDPHICSTSRRKLSELTCCGFPSFSCTMATIQPREFTLSRKARLFVSTLCHPTASVSINNRTRAAEDSERTLEYVTKSQSMLTGVFSEE